MLDKMKYNFDTRTDGCTFPFYPHYIAFRIEFDSNMYERNGCWMAFSNVPFCEESKPIWEFFDEDIFSYLYHKCILNLDIYFAEENKDDRDQWKPVDSYWIECTRVSYDKIRKMGWNLD